MRSFFIWIARLWWIAFIDKDDFSEFGVIILACKQLLSSFSNSKIEFSMKQANVIAYKLVRTATFLSSPHYFHSIPICITDTIAIEMK